MVLLGAVACLCAACDEPNACLQGQPLAEVYPRELAEVERCTGLTGGANFYVRRAPSIPCPSGRGCCLAEMGTFPCPAEPQFEPGQRCGAAGAFDPGCWSIAIPEGEGCERVLRHEIIEGLVWINQGRRADHAEEVFSCQ